MLADRRARGAPAGVGCIRSELRATREPSNAPVVRPDHVAEDGRAFLLGAVVRVPVVIHRPRVDRRRRFDLVHPRGGSESEPIRLAVMPPISTSGASGVNQVTPKSSLEMSTQRCTLNQFCTRRGSGRLRAGRRPTAHPSARAVRHLEAEPEMDAFLRADRQLVDRVDNLQ